jgi:dipeptidyl aminopeptidase/acylaminoacyl peptidase
VKPTVVTFPSTDSLFVLHSQLFLPSNYTPSTKYPAIVFTHGGPMRQMYPAMHFSGTYAQLYALNQYFVSQGYVVLSINYRMGIGYGYNFEYSSDCGELGAKEYLDVKAGALWLQSQSIVKIGNIGIYGLSYGGLNTLQALARDSDIFVAGVASAPVFNWISANRAGNDPRFQYMPLMPLVSLGIGPEPNLATPSWSDIVNTNMKLAYDSSPAGHLDTWKSPTLVIHGDSDHSVEVQESIGLVNALEDKGDVVIESLMIPDESHGMGSYSHQLQISSATFQFLLKYVTA